MTRTRYGKGKHPLDVYRDRGGKDPAMIEYLNTFQVSNCPGCGRVQRTPRGEPVACPKCVTGKTSLPGPSAAMRAPELGTGGR
jgi:hypothetical protein